MNTTFKSSLVLAAFALTFNAAPADAQSAPTPASGTVADGDPCVADGDCTTPGATCTAPAGSTAKVCTPPAPPAPAAKKSDGATCANDGECDSGFCEDKAGTKTCASTLDDGQACTRNEGCASAVCLKGKCEQCATDGDCTDPGAICASNKCVVPPASIKDGDPCTDDKDCASSSCADPSGSGTKTCQPKATPAPVPPAPTKSTIPVCPTGFVATEFPPASGSYVCIPSAPQPTAPVPAPAPQPISLETVCGSFPLSDPSSSDPEERIAGCVIYAQAQACGAEKKQFWGTCATLAQSKATGRDGVRRVQSFFATGLKLVVEKYGNRLSGRFQSATELTALTADLGRLATALARVLTATDALRLGVGTVTGAQRGIGKARPAKATVAAAPPCTGVSCQPPAPVCPPTSHRALDGSGEWGCLQQGTGLWVPPLN